jgi:hypothetical protein
MMFCQMFFDVTLVAVQNFAAAAFVFALGFILDYIMEVTLRCAMYGV